jgi:hypothetical protein
MFRRLRAAFEPQPSADQVARERILALYQRFWHEDSEQRYLTAALLRQDDEWVVCAVDGEFRGDWSVSVHGTLEEAREAILEWVREPREITSEWGLMSSTVWARLRQVILTGTGAGDPS